MGVVRSVVKQAYAQMQLADIRHLPVVDEDDRVVGILSNRDVLGALGESKGLGVLVNQIMTRDVYFVHPETRGCEATALMLDHKIGSLPVVDRERRLVGILTETDILRIAHRVLGGDALGDD